MALLSLMFDVVKPKDRHVMEQALKSMGFVVDGGGTYFNKAKKPTASDIAIHNDKLFCLVCGIAMSAREFAKKPCCKHCYTKFRIIKMFKGVK